MRVVRYELRSAAELESLSRAPLPLGIHAAQPRASSHRDLYLDTPDDALRARGVVCRLRVGERLPHRLTLVLGGEASPERIEATVRSEVRALGRYEVPQASECIKLDAMENPYALPPALADRHPVVFVNIGGISNITFVPEAGDPVAFDTGPGNTLIDQWVAAHGGVPFDADGAIAREGQIAGMVIRRYLENPFFGRPGPKSLDRNDFTLDAAAGLELADGARTLAAYPGYEFGLAGETFDAAVEPFSGVTTDEAGHADIPVKLPAAAPTSLPLTSDVNVRVLDTSDPLHPATIASGERLADAISIAGKTRLSARRRSR